MKQNPNSSRQSQAKHSRTWRSAGLWAAFSALLLAVAAPSGAASAEAARGEEILAKFREANRFWLAGPPPAVQNLTYVFQRPAGTQEFLVPDTQKAPRARLQGITYSALVHQLVRRPKSATVQALTESADQVRLELALDPPVRGACGNGVENSWTGYHSIGGTNGFLVLDPKRWVPLEAGIGRLRETFGEYVALDEQHYVPLSIRLKIGDDTEYDWHFRVYEPGLWLFDESYSAGRRLAWVENVKVNSADPKLAHAAAESLARAASEQAGAAAFQAFLAANRHWLFPSLQARRGLVYEYRQESPYLERVAIDPEGNVLARLESSKESPDRPTRQRLWLADGRTYTGNAGDRFTKLEGVAGQPAPQDRLLQHVAMGLALDCALTRAAREPEAFWAESQPVAGQNQYLLVLHAKRDARLFTGTMLTFSSWAYMHDVKYDRAEIRCDAATHRPLEEKDYSGQSELKGQYVFEEWPAGATAAPGRIRALLPYEKDGKDQALEMTARFRTGPEPWLLATVESHFRNGDGSTGTLTVVSATAESYQPIRDLLQRAAGTEQLLAAITNSQPGGVEIRPGTGDWVLAPVQAHWTDKARDSARADDKTRALPVLGVYQARLVPGADQTQTIELEGISTAAWKEFETEWKVTLRDAAGGALASVTTNLVVRAENAPAAFTAQIALPRAAAAPERLVVEGTVQRLTGLYHGHGMWLRLSRED